MFYVIKGTFHVLGYSPDGDSVRFRAHDESNWSKLAGPTVDLNARRHAQLRLEGIDTLETHFRRNLHQPLDLAFKAMDFLLSGLNITEVKWDVLRTRVISANDGTEGFILSRQVEPNRRPVAFIFEGDADVEDGREIFLDPDLLRRSLNYQQLEAGLAYATFYQGLFPDLRETMSAAVNSARQAGNEVWAEDKTNAGFDVTNLTSITDEHVILPKLFRRLAEYLEAGGDVSGFKKFLENKREGITILPAAHFTHFDNVVEVAGNTVRMTELPENLIFEG
jgi:hypothetical protein